MDSSAPKLSVAAPELYWQHDHEESVGAEISREGEIGVEGWRSQFVLEQGKIWCFGAYYRNEELAEVVSPWWQSRSIWAFVNSVLNVSYLVLQ
jgi:hypothetical protein